MELKLGVYQHYKGEQYRLVALAKREGTLEEMAVYEPLYDNPIAKTFVRPVSEFTEIVVREGYHGPRFRFIEA